MKFVITLLIVFFTANHCFGQLRYALLIGNGQYNRETLRNPENDVKLLAKKLRECNFRVADFYNLDIKQFKRSIDSFFSVINNTRCEALFYYSGHGIQHNGENYLIPVKAVLQSEADLPEECIRLQLIMDKLYYANTKTNIIILDACRNDPFSKSWSRGDGPKGLTNIATGLPQSFIAFATAPNSRATDGKGTNSPYSAALAKYITQPGITIDQVFKRVLSDVLRQNPNQRPWWTVSLESDFYFIRDRDFEVGPVPMSFLVSEDCQLYVDGELKGTFAGGVDFSLDYPMGKYKIRAVSTHDSTIYYDTLYNYDPKNSRAENYMYIPLNNKIVNIPALLRPLLDSIKFSMIRVDGGSFSMGSKSGNNDESPVHKVTLGTFHLSKYEVTQRQWQAIMGNNPSSNKNCLECPVENISWDEANEFIKVLNSLTDEHYRLPTEAEWEYAASGGKYSMGNLFSGNRRLQNVGWFYENSGGRTHPVGNKASNELGITDMSGNVREWCSDWYDASYYRNGTSNESPVGPEGGRQKTIRGGSWDEYDQPCRVSSRNKMEPASKNKMTGLRLAK